MQALWYTVLVGMLPALVAFLLLRRLEPSVIGHVRRWVRNVALCLTAISLLALWIGGTDVVGIWGLQPLATAGIMSWAPVVYLQSTILWIVVVYNLTHFIGSVDLSVEMDLPFPLQVTYLVLVTLWFSSFLRVLCTRPGKPKDFESEMLSPKPRPNNQVFCVFCQSQKPQRCRHCTKCGACVLRMDHHCPWLRQCIGFGNYKYFVAFITYSAVALLFKAVTLMLFTVRAFHGEITFWTKLWLVSTAAQPIHLLTAYPSPHSGSLGEEALVIALAGTMTAFAAFHLYLCAIGMTTIEFLTRTNPRSVDLDHSTVDLRLFPACPPSGDGRTFPHKVLPHDVDKRTKESQRALAISEETALKEKEVERSEDEIQRLQQLHSRQYDLLVQHLQRQVEEAKSAWKSRRRHLEACKQEEYELHQKVVAKEQQTQAVKSALDKTWRRMEEMQRSVSEKRATLEARANGDWSRDLDDSDGTCRQMAEEINRHMQVRQEVSSYRSQIQAALEAYRHDYQAFRAGHPLGAHGEIAQAVAPRSSASAPMRGERGGSGEAYFSEPEWGMRSSEETAAEALALPNHPDRHGHSVPVPPVAPVAPSPNFWWWLSDETRSRPDEAQLPKVPRSHLLEVARVPLRLEKVLAFGFLLCFDILLHELSFTPLQVLCALLRQVFRTNRASRRAAPAVTITEKCDLIRLSLLLANVALQSMFFSNSWVYHYIRGESFLKLYVFFNMLELAERWLRSVGVDLFDLLAARATGASGGAGAVELLPQYLLVLSYCFIHSSMHMLRVLLLTVAINTSSSAVFLIIVTNNFAEIKSTVFKRYEVKSLFPIITSDMVERFYLALDILFVLLRLATSDRRGLASAVQITSWLLLLVGIELGTDWVKFCLIMKFSELPVSVLENYQQVLIADLLVCRMPHTARDARPPSLPCMPFRGVQSFSHVVARRIGFSGLPLSTLVLSHLLHANLACQGPGVLLYLLLALILTLAKVLLSVLLLGLAARRRNSIARGLELFGKIKAL
ncbi:unnamed protein product [Durusdinium trenchii]|uniref:Palmitoyltransferase DHHC domain-containing protein n=1 Tax=Durusdinium trenchii TaxID=1381693 RepID=A0ABP0Q7Q9_9DINO